MAFSLSKEKFKDIAKNYNVIPVFREVILDLDTPVSIYIKSGAYKKDYSFILESVVGGSNRGQFSILGISSYAIVKGKNMNFTFSLTKETNVHQLKSQKPIEALKEVLEPYKFYQDKSLKGFSSGAVGFFPYDAIRYYENLHEQKKSSLKEQIKTTLPDPLSLNDMEYSLPELVVLFDHTTGRVILVKNIFLAGEDLQEKALESLYQQAVDDIEKLVDTIKSNKYLDEYKLQKKPRGEEEKNIMLDSSWKCNTSKGDFIKMVNKCKEYIKAGDIFQVVPSKRFYRNYEYEPFYLYRTLRVTNPSPYMFYLNFPEVKLIGSSPEILVKKTGDKVMVRPIAGTIRRGVDEAEDEKLSKILLNDDKEIAEHVMLVDLGRNDVGRISEYGSVKVEEFKVIEKYSHVMHIVSNVVGKLKKGLTGFDALWSGFPVGTVSGAPKVRAMQIIEELEKEKRGVYSGCIGYFSFNGDLDSCIALRTMVLKDKVLYIQAGGGIVYDSEPEKENEEAWRKSQGSFRAVQMIYNNEIEY